MNKQDRKRFDKAFGLATEAVEILRELSSEEQDKADNMPENLQGSERFDRFEAVAGALEQAADDIENAIDEAQGEIEAG